MRSRWGKTTVGVLLCVLGLVVFVDSVWASTLQATCTSQDAFKDPRVYAAIKQVMAYDPAVASEEEAIDSACTAAGNPGGVGCNWDRVNAVLARGYLWDCGSGTFYVPQYATPATDTTTTSPPPPVPRTAPFALPATTVPLAATAVPPETTAPLVPTAVPPATTVPLPPMTAASVDASRTSNPTSLTQAAAAPPDTADLASVPGSHSAGIPVWVFALTLGAAVAAIAIAYRHGKRTGQVQGEWDAIARETQGEPADW
jgi:hypothetical protein